MAGGSGGAAAPNNAHGWTRVARQAVLLLVLQLWQCMGNVEEPALEEALGGDDQCNATGTGGTCQVKMMQLRVAMMGPGKEVDELGEQEGPGKEVDELGEQEGRGRQKETLETRWAGRKKKKRPLSKEEKERCEKIRKERRNRHPKTRKNARQKKWAAKFMADLEPGVCQKPPGQECHAFESAYKIFKINCLGPLQLYCGKSIKSCLKKHQENFKSVVIVPSNFVWLGKIKKAVKMGRTAVEVGKRIVIRYFREALKDAAKEIFRKVKRKVRTFMKPPESFKDEHTEKTMEETMDAIIMGGALEFAESIAKFAYKAKQWLLDAVEFADPTGLFEVWRTFHEQECAKTSFEDMPHAELTPETVEEAEAEDGRREREKECEEGDEDRE